MKNFYAALVFVLASFFYVYDGAAANVHGVVKDNKGVPIAYATVFVNKGKGTTADAEGRYSLQLTAGTYNIKSQYIGYQENSQQITLGEADVQLDITLTPLVSTLEDVVVKAKGKDPSERIIRNAIKMKPEYRAPLDAFTCDAYIKMQMQSRAVPKSVFFKKIDKKDKEEMGVDSTGKGMIYLSESLTKYAFQKPDKSKLEIISGRESGSNGYGFNFPTFISFYNDNVQVLEMTGSRGYVSPIADGALHYYQYSYLGNFTENGKKIHRIHLHPKRKYEPLFTGEIDITEGDWRIYNIDVLITKEAQLQLLDTVRIQQQSAPINENIWQSSKQVIHFSFNILGFSMFGNALNVYSNYNTQPNFPKDYFNDIVAVYGSNVRKKDSVYWDSIRPVQLTKEEAVDFVKKDSIFQKNEEKSHSKLYQDSILAHRERLTLSKVIWDGYSRGFRNDSGKTTDYISFNPLLPRLQYNTVEGISLNSSFTWGHYFKNNVLSVSPHLRYGFSNGHFNPEATIAWSKRKDSTTSYRSYRNWFLSGGKRLSQYNNANPITPLMNEIYTLLNAKNYMKLYENNYLQLAYSSATETGWSFYAYSRYENRYFIDNSTDYSFKKNKSFTPNYPTELLDAPFTQHQALIAGFSVSYQPGQKYIQYPKYKMSIGSDKPTYTISYQKGISGVLGSDVNFDKWSASISNSENFKLRGILKYKFQIGGFLNKNTVYVQDYQHFNGNQTIYLSNYLNSFQLAPYYANSTTASFYMTGHLEHHFNGMLTNKIPLFRRLNWNLVAGSNAFYVNKNNNYVEVFGGLENIFKIYRVDFVQSFLNGNKGQFGVRLGIGGLFSR